MTDQGTLDQLASPARKRGPFARMHLRLFVPAVLIVSAASGFAVFVVVALLDPFLSRAIGDGAVAVGMLVTLGGLILPALLLIRSRRRQAPVVERASAASVAASTNASACVGMKPRFAAEAQQPRAPCVQAHAGIATPARDLAPIDMHASAAEEEGAEADQTQERVVRIVDWGFFTYATVMVPIMVALATNGARSLCVVIALYVYAMELAGVVVGDTRITYPVRLVIWGPYAFPLFRRTVLLDDMLEASAETEYNRRRRNNPFPRVRLLHLSGRSSQAKIWFSGKGRRDWLFAQLRLRAPHVRQYRGGW